jgi:glycosyltransferase involved in cell wall biosynthesis
MAGPGDHAFGREMKALVASLGITERVTWTGMLSGDLKWGSFHAADAFVLTSHQENFGIAVVEALACGVPVLISNQVNIWREIEQAGAGFVDSDDPAGAERLLERWVGVDAALWQRMRRAARNIFYERFVIDRAADSLIHAMRMHALRTAGTP